MLRQSTSILLRSATRRSNPSLTLVTNPNRITAHNAARLLSSLPVPTPEQNYLPINFDTSSHVAGDESQIVTVSLSPHHILRAESGAMIYMTDGVQMNTTLGSSSSSALSSGVSRVMTGQNLFLSDYTYTGPEGTTGEVALGTEFPSKILRISLEDYGNKVICQKGAFLCGSHTVDIEMEFTKNFTSGFFGGEGFILQKLTGTGEAFIKAGGTLVRRDLREGEVLRVSSGCLVAFTQQVEYDVQMVQGFKNVMFGGEGLFVTTLKGPGTVWLQSMPPDRMISEIARRIPSGGPGIGFGVPIGMGGGGGGGAAEEVGAGAATEEAGLATDAAVEADRQATVASSGIGGDAVGGDYAGPSDPDSPESLFGDAASKEDTSAMGSESLSSTGGDDFGIESFSEELPELDDSTSFTTDDRQSTEFDDGFGEDSTSFDDGSMDFGEDAANQTAESAKSIFSQLWDFFNDD